MLTMKDQVSPHGALLGKSQESTDSIASDSSHGPQIEDLVVMQLTAAA